MLAMPPPEVVLAITAAATNNATHHQLSVRASLDSVAYVVVVPASDPIPSNAQIMVCLHV